MTVQQGAAGANNPRRTLRVVKPVEIDIYAKWRAEIAARDWGAVHVAGGRNEPLDIPDRRKWSWRK